MLNALNTAATGMVAQTKNIEVISNNIANADTTSFKRSRAEFQDLLYQTQTDPGAATSATTANTTGTQIGAGAKLIATSREHQTGAPKPTGRDFDFAIDGNGFFSIQQGNNEIGYTRDGTFDVGPGGIVETHEGYQLIPQIAVPADVIRVSVSKDGRVTTVAANGTSTEIGQIQLTNFVNPAGLRANGGNIYSPTPASGAPQPGNPGDVGFGRLNQGFLEASNVSPVDEMTGMIRAQRVYEMNSKVISTTDQMMQTLNAVR